MAIVAEPILVELMLGWTAKALVALGKQKELM